MFEHQELAWDMSQLQPTPSESTKKSFKFVHERTLNPNSSSNLRSRRGTHDSCASGVMPTPNAEKRLRLVSRAGETQALAGIHQEQSYPQRAADTPMHAEQQQPDCNADTAQYRGYGGQHLYMHDVTNHEQDTSSMQPDLQADITRRAEYGDHEQPNEHDLEQHMWSSVEVRHPTPEYAGPHNVMLLDDQLSSDDDDVKDRDGDAAPSVLNDNTISVSVLL